MFPSEARRALQSCAVYTACARGASATAKVGRSCDHTAAKTRYPKSGCRLLCESGVYRRQCASIDRRRLFGTSMLQVAHLLCEVLIDNAGLRSVIPPTVAQSKTLPQARHQPLAALVDLCTADRRATGRHDCCSISAAALVCFHPGP